MLGFNSFHLTKDYKNKKAIIGLFILIIFISYFFSVRYVINFTKLNTAPQIDAQAAIIKP